MSSFDDLKSKIVNWLSEEEHKEQILQGDLFNVLNNVGFEFGWRGCVFLFNSLVSIFGLDKVLERTQYSLPEPCLVSSKLPSHLELEHLYCSPVFLRTSDEQKNSITDTKLKDLVLKNCDSQLTHLFIDQLQLDSLTINNASISLHPILNSGEILYSIKTVYLNGNYPKDGKYVPVQIDPKSYSIPFRLEKIYFGKQFNTFLKSSFSECDRPLTIYVSAPTEVKFQKGAFNINVNHEIYVPKSAKVICAKEDSDYFRNHMKRY